MKSRTMCRGAMIAYGLLGVSFWTWIMTGVSHLRTPPDGFQANLFLALLVIGGIAFGIGGVVLNRWILRDGRSETYIYAVLLSALLQAWGPGFPHTLGAWTLLGVMILSLASALYCLRQALMPLETEL